MPVAQAASQPARNRPRRKTVQCHAGEEEALPFATPIRQIFKNGAPIVWDMSFCHKEAALASKDFTLIDRPSG